MAGRLRAQARPGRRAAKLGLHGAVQSLTRPKSKALVGPNPTDGEGGALAPKDAWGHDHLWWLDKMVRTEAPLVERMTLVWHDWFATSKSGVPQRLMIDQNQLLRRHALGNFEELALDITRDPAMLLWLNGTSNNRWDVNENYARELQELFCLGAGRGYSERDVRQLARALTGFRNDWTDSGPTRFRYDKKVHDAGRQEDLRQAREVRLAGGRAPGHAPPPPPGVHGHQALGLLHPDQAVAVDRQGARRACTWRSGREVRPLLEAILAHPDLYDAGRRMVKPPVVQAAGMLRAVGRGIDTNAWAWLCDSAGQYLFLPPNVSGWDDTRWLDTATFRARWQMAQHICEPARLDPDAAAPSVPPDPAGLVDEAIALLGLARDLRRRSAPGSRSTPPTPWPPPPSGGRRPSSRCSRSTRCGCWSRRPPTT